MGFLSVGRGLKKHSVPPKKRKRPTKSVRGEGEVVFFSRRMGTNQDICPAALDPKSKKKSPEIKLLSRRTRKYEQREKESRVFFLVLD